MSSTSTVKIVIRILYIPKSIRASEYGMDDRGSMCDSQPFALSGSSEDDDGRRGCPLFECFFRGASDMH